MAEDKITLPKSIFRDLDLKSGDKLEGSAGSDIVEIRVLRQSGQRTNSNVARTFVEKWLGKFPDIDKRTDPRLEALVRKHVKDS